jgi:hypothetical protein
MGSLPMTEVRQSLARARSEGVDFDTAWRRATAGLPQTWAMPLNSTKSAWETAYRHEPPPTCGAWSTLRASRE